MSSQNEGEILFSMIWVSFRNADRKMAYSKWQSCQHVLFNENFVLSLACLVNMQACPFSGCQ